MTVTAEKAHCAFFLLRLYLKRLPTAWLLPSACRLSPNGSRSWGTVYIFVLSALLSKHTLPPVSMCKSVLISPMKWKICSWSVNNAVLASTQPDQIILSESCIIKGREKRKDLRTIVDLGEEGVHWHFMQLLQEIYLFGCRNFSNVTLLFSPVFFFLIYYCCSLIGWRAQPS